MSDTQKRAVLARSVVRGKVVKIKIIKEISDKKNYRTRLHIAAYFYKMRGSFSCRKKYVTSEVLLAGLGAMLGMLALALVNINLWDQQGTVLLLGSFGATIVLIFGAPELSASQPRNVLGGHILSALVGVVAQGFLGSEPWIAASVSVGGSVIGMLLTSTIHPLVGRQL